MRSTKTWLRAALTGLLVAAAIVPAQAASFGFNWSLTNRDEYLDRHRNRQCFMTDYQIRQTVAREGFTNIKLASENNNVIQATAYRDGQRYKLIVDICYRQIVDGGPA